MLAGVRARFVVSLFSLLVTLSLTTSFPSQAQVSPIPPSITSTGFGGRAINGVPPSITSLTFGNKAILGAKGNGNSWSIFGDCCSDFFFPAQRGLPLTAGHNRRHRHGDRGDFAVGIMEPAYAPAVVPYAPDDKGDDSAEADAGQSPAPPPPGKRPVHRLTTPDANLGDSVSVQPSTTLIFKDGHQADIINYAIVGDTLFEFADGRTRKIQLAGLDLPATQKANDDRGVDFQIPAIAKGQ
ncbi:MAG TPA: hypothetical protein VK828_13000 [Terriglobales bacterium]|jgi:hypothetical protein|nr:hypothetical protein [Terriglobales bacterium]